MNNKNKTKLCWNCEGSIDLKAEKCPFCGVSTDVSPIPGTQPKKAQAPQASNKKAPAGFYQPKEEIQEESKESPFQATALAISALLLGTVLAIFSLMLALFSNSKGVFSLSWNGDWWYVYLAIALPLLWIGWRTAARLNAEAE